MDQPSERVVLRLVDGARQRLALLPAGLVHEDFPKIDASDVHILCYFARDVCILLGTFIGAVELRIPLALDSMLQKSLFHRRWSYQQ